MTAPTIRHRRSTLLAVLTAVGLMTAALTAVSPASATDTATGISQIKLTYGGEPQTSFTVSWRDAPTAGGGSLQVVPKGTDFATCAQPGGTCQVVKATRAAIGSADGPPYAFYQAQVTGLKPGTAYEYRVSDGAAPGPVYAYATPAGGAAPLRAALLGEVHIGDDKQPGWPVPALAPTLAQVAKSGAQLAVSTGDNINTGANEAEWERLFAASPQFFGTTPYMSAVGNHETYGGFGRGTPAAQYFAAFPQPGNGDGSGRYYSYDVNGVHFAVVEANPETPKAYFQQEMAWLERDLKDAAKRTRFQVVIDHSPPFHSKTSRVTPTYENPEFREALVPLMDRYGVELVVSGHDKHYVRSFPLVGRKDRGAVPSIAPEPVKDGKGTTYVELTSTGNTYSDFLQQDWMAKAVPVTAAYLQLDFGDRNISARTVQPDGTVIDAFTIPTVR